ncbi:MAG: hypothetical protein ACT4ON_12430, partial [Bacteroidota bacterium]
MRLKPQIFLLLILPITIFLSFNKHSKDKANSYHDVLWADAAGYYVYHPIWFIYGNNSADFPDNIEKKTGDGFYLDSVNNKVITKYPCGAAVLQTPFFIISHLLAEPLGFKADGFSKIYSFGIYFAGVFYCCFGLFFLSKFLSLHFSSFVSVVGPLMFLVGSNLYYYTIDAPGMSHIYSFFLFSLIIYLTPFVISKTQFRYYFLFFCCMVLAILTRPTNILIVLFPLFYNIKNKTEFLTRITFLSANKLMIILSLMGAMLLAIPQLYYWHSNTGNIITDSYTNESFSFWNNPKLLETWFSANNGLFVYTPLVFLCIAGIILMIKNEKNWNGYFIGVLFMIISYV